MRNFQKCLFSLRKNMESSFYKPVSVATETWALAQLLTKTWYPYLLSIPRILPDKFEKHAHATKILIEE